MSMIRNFLRLGLSVVLLVMLSVTAYAQILSPILNNISPDAGTPQVISITLAGDYFQHEGNTTTVSFNGKVVATDDILFISDNCIITLVPQGATSGPVVVSVGGVNSNSLDFIVAEGDFEPDEVSAELLPGASIGPVLAMTGLELANILPLGRTTWYLMQIPDSRDIPQAIRDLFQTDLVASAEANFRFQGTELPSKQNQPRPDDLCFDNNPADPCHGGEQYGPQRIRAVDANNKTPDAHRLAKGDDITIAIVDTGIDDAHEDLAEKVINGQDFVNWDNDPDDDHSHGTHVAGIAAAITHNAKGIAGVAPKAKLLAEKVLGATGGGTSEQIAAGICDSVNQEADVINLSLGGHAPSIKILRAVGFAVNRGIPVVAAAGNDGEKGSPAGYPAAFSHPRNPDGLIAVANSALNDAIVNSSTRGNYVDVAAPGLNILSTIPGNNYSSMTGTSMSAPHVSGVVALMLERDPLLTPCQVECLLEITAVDIENPDFDIASGHGRVDAYAAVHALMSLGGRYHLLPPECNKCPDWPDWPGWPDNGCIRLPLPPDQVIPITSDSRIAMGATTADSSIKINLATNAVASFDGVPVSDVVVTPDDRYAIVMEFSGDDWTGRIRRIDLTNDTVATIEEVRLPLTELTLTPDGGKALLGTFLRMEVIDVAAFTNTTLNLNVITGISVTPDSQKALVGEPGGVTIVDLNTMAQTTLATGFPITGIAITPDGSKAVVGVPGGVSIIDINTSSVAATLTIGVAVSNIALMPDSRKAVYATTTGGVSNLIIVNLVTPSATSVTIPAIPVTDVDVTSDCVLAVVGTQSGVSIIDIATATVTDLVLPTPLLTGLSIYSNNKWATVGTPDGVSCINLNDKTSATVTTTTDPVTNVSIAPDNSICLVGIESGVALIDCRSLPATATELTMSRPLIGATISADSQKAVIGTETGFSVIDLSTVSATEVSLTPPVLNFLSDDTQPPLNPFGERGKTVSSEG